MTYTTQFSPGKPVVATESSTGLPLLIRYPQWEDLPELLRFINELSEEDTYVTLSGEAVTVEEELDFLLNWYKRMEQHDGVYLVCEHRENIVGVCEVAGVESDRERGKHVGVLGVSVAKDYRQQGIATTLISAVLEEVRMTMPHISLVRMSVFEENEAALKLYHQLGFQEAGRLPEALLYKDAYQASVELYKKLA